MRSAAEIKRRHYSRNIARSFKWMGYILLFQKKTLRSFYTQMHNRFACKWSGFRNAPAVLLLLLFERRDHFTPNTYTMGLKLIPKSKYVYRQATASSSLCMNVLDSTGEKKLFRFLLLIYIVVLKLNVWQENNFYEK